MRVSVGGKYEYVRKPAEYYIKQFILWFYLCQTFKDVDLWYYLNGKNKRLRPF